MPLQPLAEFLFRYLIEKDLQAIDLRVGDHAAALKFPTLYGVFYISFQSLDPIPHPMDIGIVVGEQILRIGLFSQLYPVFTS
jgi:hypothetical protein